MSADSANVHASAPERLAPRRTIGAHPEDGGEVATAAREFTFAAIVDVLLRHRRLILLATAISVGYSVVVAVAKPPTYSATVSFVPQRQTPSFGLASQLAGGPAAPDVLQSAPFYAELVNSRVIAGYIVDSVRIPLSTGGQASIAEALKIQEGDARATRNAAMGTVQHMISPSVNPRTQVIVLTVQAPRPDVAVAVANGALASLVRFNHGVHQSAATAERRFIEVRRDEIRAQLSGAENRLQEFLRRNRGGLDSPELDFERQRLTTAVELQRQLYATLSEGYERARMDEVRDTPVITRIDPPERPAGPDQRNLLRVAILALIGGLFAGVVLAFVIESFMRTRGQLKAA